MNTKSEIEEATSRLRMQEITGVSNKGRVCLGIRKNEYFSSSTVKSKREMIVSEIKKNEEYTRIIQRAQISKQGQQMRWEVQQRCVKSDDLLRMPDVRLKVIIKAVMSYSQRQPTRMCGTVAKTDTSYAEKTKRSVTSCQGVSLR